MERMMTYAHSNWREILQPNKDATLRLFCFYPLGLGAASYAYWPTFLPASIEVSVIHLPSRQSSLVAESLHPSSLLPDVARAIEDGRQPGQVDAFFGHCSGALWAIEVARYLSTHSHVQPARLFVASCPAPHK